MVGGDSMILKLIERIFITIIFPFLLLGAILSGLLLPPYDMFDNIRELINWIKEEYNDNTVD